ncbi:acyltransferase [Pseudomonas sp. C32]|uniref:acyltransferase family protein n=1 Tax=Pseudomonas sp. C32 TaxID=1529208 RepID=UPI00260DA1B8|nr:acyltransferase [Pseudomonas sp. C32]MDN4548018.1 acyltransferase [Pseudomonas sp. C32]
MKTIEVALQSKYNNIDLIRILAAILVLIAHSWPLTGSEVDPVASVTGGLIGGGSLAVCVFFVLSGLLVTKSALERSTEDYVISRILRIVPALLLVSLFDVIIIGGFFTNLGFREYITNPTTMEHLLNFMVFPIQYNLPGVFEGGTYPHVNGSLWTLPIECALYIFLPILVMLRLLTRRTAALALLALISIFIYSSLYLNISDASRGPFIFKAVQTWSILHYGLFFFIGSFSYIYRKEIPLSGALAIIMIIALYGAKGTSSQTPVLYLSLSYITIFLAIGIPQIFSLKKIGDLSYGTYIFAWPVQKAVITAFALTNPVAVAVFALPLTLVLAYGSWRFVERPMLNLKRKFVLRSTKESTFVSNQ